MIVVIVCLTLGALLILAEAMMPKAAFGIPGLLMLTGGVVMAYLTFEVNTAHIILAATLASLIVSFGLWFRFFPQSAVGERLTAKGTVGEPDKRYRRWLGKTGVASSDLRPGGKALIDGEVVDVVARAGFVEKGTSLRVVEATGNRVLVDVIEANEAITS